MSRANDDTQVDYSLLDDEQLADAVAEKVLGLQQDKHGWWCDEEGLQLDVDVNWATAGLVIDTLRAEGYHMEMDVGGDGFVFAIEPFAPTRWMPTGPRAILIAALRAKEAE